MADPAATLTELLGAEAVREADQWGDTLATTLPLAVGLARPPVVYPATEAELAAAMTCAHQNRWRVLPCGSGSKLAWGDLATGIDVVISTARLTQIIDHAVGDMTLTAQAGVSLGALAPILASANQFLALDPAYPQRATLGGLVATGDAGSLRQRYGGVRDMLLGLTLVRYDGQVAKAGGRVVKNVAGYDLMKLLTGSYGTLGIISQLTFRLFPQQDASQTVIVPGAAPAIAALLDMVRRSSLTPVSLDVLSPALTASLGYGADLALVARFQSIAPGVDEQVETLRRTVSGGLSPQGLSPQVIEGAAEIALWSTMQRSLFPEVTEVTGVTEVIGMGAAAPLSKGAIAKVGLLPKAILPFMETLAVLDSTAVARLHGGSGLGTVRLGSGMAAEPLAEVVTKLRSHCEQASGYLTLLEAPTEIKQAVGTWGKMGNSLTLMKAIKAQFDPDYRLSPGRFVGGL